jgi:hypothetical protein
VASTLDSEARTPEFLEFQLKSRERDIERLSSENVAQLEELRKMRLLLLGICAEQFHLSVTLSPEIFDKNTFQAVQHLISQHAKRTAAEIEGRLGGPLRRLQEALMHIHYLENHASRQGLQFTQWAVTENDRKLYY